MCVFIYKQLHVSMTRFSLRALSNSWKNLLAGVAFPPRASDDSLFSGYYNNQF